MAEEIKSLVDVYYGDTLIGQVANGETGNVNCTGHEMSDDIRIKVPYDMKAIRLQTKSATINKNGQTVVFPDDGYVMSAAVLTVEVPSDNEWLGEFDADTEYRVGSIVSQNNMVYICIVKPTDNQPPTNTTYWELLSGKIQDEKIVDIITHGKLEFLPDDGYVAVRKFTANVAETPTFDGTINIESGYTTISGTYIIDETEAYTLLNSLTETKTYTVSFSAGGTASGMGDSIDFTSMTFDHSNGLILYGSKGAFSMNGGFAEYTNNYGSGNGAMVAFAEGTQARKDFVELFLSIADEYVAPVTITFTIDGTSYTAEEGMTWADWCESDYDVDGFMLGENVYNADGSKYISGVTPTDVIVAGTAYTLESAVTEDSLAGTWVFNDTLAEFSGDTSTATGEFNSNGQNFTSLNIQNDYGDMYVNYGGINAYSPSGWVSSAYKTLNIISPLADTTISDALLTWLKANATKQ